MTSVARTDEWRTSAAYTLAQAARLAQVSPSSAKRWLYGQETAGATIRPVFGQKAKGEGARAQVSFLELIELVVAARFRRKGVALDRVRRAHAFARKEFHTKYPFASMKLGTDGVHVLHHFQQLEPGASLVALDQAGQLTLPHVVQVALETFEFEEGLAARWYPVGKGRPIVIDPRFGTGMPTIMGRRVRVATIHDRFLSGDSVQFIADDFELDPRYVEEALRYAEKYAA